MIIKDLVHTPEVDIERDAIDEYFECITACSIDNEGMQCITQCVEVHLKKEIEQWLPKILYQYLLRVKKLDTWKEIMVKEFINHAQKTIKSSIATYIHHNYP